MSRDKHQHTPVGRPSILSQRPVFVIIETVQVRKKSIPIPCLGVREKSRSRKIMERCRCHALATAATCDKFPRTHSYSRQVFYYHANLSSIYLRQSIHFEH